MNYKFSTPKTISVIIVYFLLFLAGDLLGSLIFDFLFSIINLPVRELYPIIRMPGYLLLTLIFFWLYTTKVLHLKMEDFGISFSVKWWGVSLSVLLPAFCSYYLSNHWTGTSKCFFHWWHLLNYYFIYSYCFESGDIGRNTIPWFHYETARK